MALPGGQIYQDVAMYSGVRLYCEKEMYEMVEGLERL